MHTHAQKFPRSTQTALTIFFAVASFFTLSLHKAEATSLWLENTKPLVSVGDAFTLTLWTNTESVDINALEGTVTFPTSLVTLSGVNISDSIISLWAVVPKKTDAASVSFSGGIPGGYTGSRGQLVTLTFTAKGSGDAKVNITDARSVKNDGLATLVPTTTVAKTIHIQEKAVAPTTIVPEGSAVTAPEKVVTPDRNPPEPFILYLTKNPSMYNGKWYTLAQVVDKESQLAGYFIYESKSELPKEEADTILREKGQFVESLPYVLGDQTLKSYVYVGAYDAAGNLRVSALTPEPAFSTTPLNMAVIAILLMVIIFLLLLQRTKKKLAQ